MAFKFLGQRQLGKLPSRWVSTILMVAIVVGQAHLGTTGLIALLPNRSVYYETSGFPHTVRPQTPFPSKNFPKTEIANLSVSLYPYR